MKVSRPRPTAVSPAGLFHIEAFEGFVPHIYRDAGGVATVGYGTTSAVVSPLPSSVTRAQAEVLLQYDLRKTVYPALRPWTGVLNQAQFDALADAIYNLGPGVLEAGRSLGDALRSPLRHYLVPDALMKYVHDGSQVLPGLVRRRSWEATLWATGRYG